MLIELDLVRLALDAVVEVCLGVAPVAAGRRGLERLTGVGVTVPSDMPMGPGRQPGAFLRSVASLATATVIPPRGPTWAPTGTSSDPRSEPGTTRETRPRARSRVARSGHKCVPYGLPRPGRSTHPSSSCTSGGREGPGGLLASGATPRKPWDARLPLPMACAQAASEMRSNRQDKTTKVIGVIMVATVRGEASLLGPLHTRETETP